MLWKILLLIFSFSNALIFAEVTVPTLRPQPRPQGSNLPQCIDSQSDIDRVANHQRNNRRNDSKYLIYRQLLQSDSDSELLARLVYAETLGANCSDHNEKLVPLITNVIVNRIRRREGNVRSVVFQRDQFSSSLNIYSSSRYKDFLCPKNSALWNQALEKSNELLQNSNDSSGDLSSDSINYFLPSHDPRWPNPPDWGLRENTAAVDESLRECLRIFHVPNWK